MGAQLLPTHLKKYIVEQDYERYNPIDHACWRFILRQLHAFLGQHAHESYLDGLKKTGIEIERIPKISDISAKLEKFGWRALPVSGFIPPAAFMELQSLSILPIASDMRSIGHLMYTPAPDIVHEAAGHAPLLANKDFADYLGAYSQVARKAIISKGDLDIYEAIRSLSDIKESPDASEQEIQEAQRALELAIANNTHVSEATELSRMNWWTAEYGLIGSLENPKIYGAGLLSSVGESRWCLSDRVKKIPLSIDCIKMTYDITEPQPQLFVTPDFKTLTKVLEEMASAMAYRTGGASALKKALESKVVNTVQLDSGLQISGVLNEVIWDEQGEAIYLKVSGPCQLSIQDKEIKGHGRDYHAQGYGTPLGAYVMSTSQAKVGDRIELTFVSGVKVKGDLVSTSPVLMSFKNCTVSHGDNILFHPDWGTFDMAIGKAVTSVFGGPADRDAFGETEDFVAKRVPRRAYTPFELEAHDMYARVRRLRESDAQGEELAQSIAKVFQEQKSKFTNDWLILLECLELVSARLPNDPLKSQLQSQIQKISQGIPEQRAMVEEGLALAERGLS